MKSQTTRKITRLFRELVANPQNLALHKTAHLENRAMTETQAREHVGVLCKGNNAWTDKHKEELKNFRAEDLPPLPLLWFERKNIRRGRFNK